MMHWLYHAGLAGLVLISTVDSSFVPLPIPGVTDILIILYAASHANLFVLVGLATVGSALGGFLSHWAAQAGGMAFLIRELLGVGLLHEDVATVAGPTRSSTVIPAVTSTAGME